MGVKREVKKVSASEAASALSSLRWEKATPAERLEVGRKLAAGRRRLPRAIRSAIASKAGSSISSDAASARAKKAWETKRRKAAEQKKLAS